MNTVRSYLVSALISTLALSSASFGAINPAQAFSTALKLVEDQVRWADLDGVDDLTLTSVTSVHRGKYLDDEFGFGDYRVQVTAHSQAASQYYICESNMTISKVYFAMQYRVVVLEEVHNEYQIIAKLSPISCKKSH